MRHFFTLATCCFFTLLLVAGQSHAAPLTTRHFSLDLPPDWVVVSGPSGKGQAVQVLLGQKDHKCSALIVVGPAGKGEGEQAANVTAQRLGGGTPAKRNGQWEFAFTQKGVRGYGVAREDAAAGLLLMLVVSGSDMGMADFVFRMRSPYKALVPLAPSLR